MEAGTGYTLVGNTATEIGEYTATAALQNTTKYQWADGATDAKEIKWSIGKGAAPAAPTGLKATSPTKKDGRDGQISGTTDKMEYATNSGFTNAKDCTGNTITGLPAGTYYVRVKETDKFEAGSYAVVKVLAFGEVEEVPVPPVEVKIPVSGEEKTVEVVASIKDSTAVVSTIDTTQLGSVIGEKVDTGMVLIDFSGLEQEIDTVELPGAAIGEIAAAAQAQGNDVEGLSLKLSTGSVSFDAAALASIQKQAGSKVTLKILAKDRHDLTPGQLESIGTAPAFDLSLQGNAAITDFGKGKATVSLPYTLKPGQSAAGITVYYLDEKGKASACPTRYSQVEKAATYTTSHFSLYFVGFDSAIQWKNPFNDVRKGDWFYGAVEFAELNGLMQGDSKTVFSPNQKLSRAQLAQILYNKEGRPWVSGGSSFTDVPAKEWYANAVNWAAQKGYVMGYDGTHFGPNDSVTREQLATILWRYAGEPKAKKSALSSFTDAGKASEYALPALRWAVQNGIVRGKGNNRLDPTGTATRAEVAQMLMNFLA
ncbi:S-layer homology domain-containing protein [Neglecta sp. X4]|nr:S-layer homology domain-containing protein [Neglectibacter sp. 59]NBJ73325.1 S-layer homology domain-containing protein [Neglectibacter sp. X4]NCE81222.1 S-layer homology domain-containing protein [Neglectibacter sp. X58]